MIASRIENIAVFTPMPMPSAPPLPPYVGPSSVSCDTVTQDSLAQARKDLTTYSAAIKRANQNISEIDDRMGQLSYPPLGMGNREAIIAQIDTERAIAALLKLQAAREGMEAVERFRSTSQALKDMEACDTRKSSGGDT
jgi:hypothetical protein